ncbi:hypothetical protein AQUCO_01900062v1, partial [Aquilegia coerulea]
MITWPWHLALWSGICLAVAIHLLTKHRKISRTLLPPGPPGWPIIGNIFDLDSAAHDTLERLSRKYGPVLWLRLGAVNTMVVSSAKAAAEMFKNHDIAFAGRTTNEALRVNSYDEGSMALSQYGSYWRMLRRICTTELFTNNRINGTQGLRMKCVDSMMKWMWDEAQEKGSVEVARFLGLMSFNISSNVMLSKNLVDPQSKQGDEFFESINHAMELCAKPNIADFFPFLRWFDPQGIKKKTELTLGRTHKFAYSFVEERILERQNGRKSAKKDFLDVLLDFQGNNKDGEPAKISDKNIGLLIFELFAASTDTTTNTVEWALAELLRNPSIMRKLQDEVDQVLGKNKKIDETDIVKLEYLHAVVKETLRLHPPVPLLIPRKAMKDTEFMGYLIPENTQILVNVWAIGRDPASWEDPLSFKPERFLSSNIDYKGGHYHYIPFGAGRRICVGMPLAQRSVHLALGSLIQSFEWSLEDGTTPENIDMRERLGVALRKTIPLKA